MEILAEANELLKTVNSFEEVDEIVSIPWTIRLPFNGDRMMLKDEVTQRTLMTSW